MEKHFNDLKRVLKAIGYSPLITVKLNEKANQIALEIPYAQKGHAKQVYNRIKEAIS